MRKIHLVVISSLMILSACASRPSLEATPTYSLAEVCESIVGEFIGSSAAIEIESTAVVVDHQDLPTFCQFKGLIQQKINFELRAPITNWNGKLVVAGCGGFCGALFADKQGHSNSINESLKLGYAAITTDSGHQAKSWETYWAVNDAQLLELFAGAWMPAAVDGARLMLEKLYSNTPKRTYFSGCSNGGRLGMMAAQRYPELFDGIAAGSGIFDLTGQSGLHGIWLLQATRDKDNKAVIDYTKLPLLEATVLAQCDHLDGQTDGLISDPRACKPDLEVVRCEQGVDNNTCLAASELEAIEKLYQGATIDGKPVFAGLPPGSEGLWQQWITGGEDSWGWGELAVMGTLRLVYGLDREDALSVQDLNIKDELVAINKLAPVLDATDPDLSAFHDAGGKMIYYHGKADPLILYQRAEQYAGDMRGTMGMQMADQTARFYMIPGFGHCWEDPNRAPDQFNPVVEIDKWVELGIAPEYIDVEQQDDSGKVLRERRICAYPQVARLVSANVDDASSYHCVTETAQ